MDDFRCHCCVAGTMVKAESNDKNQYFFERKRYCKYTLVGRNLSREICDSFWRETIVQLRRSTTKEGANNLAMCQFSLHKSVTIFYTNNGDLHSHSHILPCRLPVHTYLHKV